MKLSSTVYTILRTMFCGSKYGDQLESFVTDDFRILCPKSDIIDGLSELTVHHRRFKESLLKDVNISRGRAPKASELDLHVELIPENTIMNKKHSNCCLNFLLRSSGLRELGYQSELSVNGLIRCTLREGLIANAHIFYDLATIVRQL